MEIVGTSNEQMDHILIDVEELLDAQLASSVTGELENLSPLSADCCIYRVPKRLRELNQKAYTPQVVSIGPLHHGRDESKAMEEHKKRFLQDFLRRTKVSVKQFVTLIRGHEKKLRNCHAEPIKFSSDDFVRMILVDAIFIIELFSKHSYKNRGSDYVFSQRWAICDMHMDMILLENQLPFFILEELLNLADIILSSDNNHGVRTSLIDLTIQFLKIWYLVPEPCDHLTIYSQDFEHFVDFIMFLNLPLTFPSKEKYQTLTMPSVEKLHHSGLKFEITSSDNLFDITFENGILRFPKMTISDDTEVILRNLLAFEECQSLRLIAEYVSIMNYLVNAPKDVELLAENGIIENLLEDSAAVSTLFQNLSKGIEVPNVYFGGLNRELNSYYRSSWHKWKAVLKQNYFNNPWASISVVAAAILLILTVIQTVCSIMQVR